MKANPKRRLSESGQTSSSTAILSATLASILIASCGTQPSEAPDREGVAPQQTEAPAVSTPLQALTKTQQAELQAEYSNIPEGIVVKVPVDSKGNELASKAEIRSVNGTNGSINNVSVNNVGEVWSQATSPEELKMKETTGTSELSRASSSLVQINSQGEFGRAQPTVSMGLRQPPNGNNFGNNNRNPQHSNYSQNSNYNQHSNYSQNSNYNQHSNYSQNSNYNQHNRLGGYHRYYRGYRDGFRDGFRAGYYMNYYRPIWFSRSYQRGYWGYNRRPRYFNRGGFHYYYYGRPACHNYYYCRR